MRPWFLIVAGAVASGASAQTPAPKPLAPQIGLSVSRDVAPGPKIRLSLNTRNVDRLRLTAVRIDPDAWLRLRTQEKPPVVPAIAAPVVLGTLSMIPPKPEQDASQIDHYRSRQVNLPRLPPGVYRLTAEGAGTSAAGVVNITNLAVLVKRAPRTALVWVTDHRSGRVVPGADVQLVDRTGKALARAHTGSEGVARLPVVPGTEQTVLVHTRTDVAGVAAGAEDPDGRLVAHVSTDRPIYRPGQGLAWKAILRTTHGAAYSPLVNQPVEVELRDSRESVLEKKTLTTTAFGTVSGQLDLPGEMALGPASLVLKVGRQSAYTTITVAAYRKPEFTITVAPEQKRYFAGEKAAFLLDTRYFFGSPVPGAVVRYQIRRTATAWNAGDEDAGGWYSGGDGNLYPADSYRTDPFVTEGEAQTDQNGQARIAFTTTKDTPDSSYTLTATVIDGQRRQGEAGASVPVYAAALRLGLQLHETTVAQGKLFPVQVRAVDLDNRPARATVTVTAERSVWDQKQGRAHWERVAEAQVRAPGTTTLPAQASGVLRLTARARDSEGRIALTRTELWVAAPDYKPDRTVEPEVSVRLDRRLYKPGEIAQAFVTTNTPARPILVTVEGGDVFAWTVLPGGKTSYRWAIPTTLALSPNVTVEVAQWAAPARLVSGNVLLALPDTSRRLNLAITPGKKQYEPGETATATLRLTDEAGRPVRGEVAVGVVDAAIYALRPDTTAPLFTHFWGLRANQTQTFQSAPEEVSGGAYQRANGQNAPLRQRFVDTAFWDAHLVTTAADGTASLAFPVPGNLTTWRWTARAVNEATQVGEATTDTIATRPVTLRLALPRQSVVGDTWTLVGTVNNRTDQPRALTVTLEGFPSHTLTVPARGEGRVTWDVATPRWTPGGTVSFTAAVHDPQGEVLDQLRQSVPLLPQRILQRVVVGRLVHGSATVELPVLGAPESGPRQVTVEARVGLTGALRTALRAVLESPPSSPEEAADTLLALSAAQGIPGVAVKPELLRDAQLLLARTQRPEGTWGHWEGALPDAYVSAKVLRALTTVSSRLLPSARAGALQLYNQSDHWERRALLAAALRDSGEKSAPAKLEEVTRRGRNLSPYARLRLRLPDGLVPTGGPERASILVGSRPGWRTSTVEASAEALFSFQGGDAARLARGLAFPEESGRTRSENTAVALGLAHYLREHPERSATLARVTVAINGGAPASLDANGRLTVALDQTNNRVTVTSDEEVFVTLTTRAPLPPSRDSALSAPLRRLAVPTAEGLWKETTDDATLQAGQTLRLTLLAWPDESAEVLTVEQALPAGFELVDEESDSTVYTEVRDNRLLHRFLNTGRPVLIRVYLRPESLGSFTLTPALLENVLAPNAPAQSAPARLRVVP